MAGLRRLERMLTMPPIAILPHRLVAPPPRITSMPPSGPWRSGSSPPRGNRVVHRDAVEHDQRVDIGGGAKTANAERVARGCSTAAGWLSVKMPGILLTIWSGASAGGRRSARRQHAGAHVHVLQRGAARGGDDDAGVGKAGYRGWGRRWQAPAPEARFA
jgi:hypothetical protein